MTDFEVEVILDQTRAFKPMLLKAAFGDDQTWQHTYELASIPEVEAAEIRAYLVEAYGPDGGRK